MWPFSPTFPELSPEDVGCQSTLHSESDDKGVYDYIICGGGTSGAVLANRLSEDPSVSVLLVERGASSFSLETRVPVLSMPIGPKLHVARLPTVPLANLENRSIPIPVGQCLGGSSRINGFMYMRGTASEYNRWSALGRKGWAYDDLEPYFVKSEGMIGRPVPKHRGNQGPWQNRTFTDFYFDSVAKCAEAVALMGIPMAPDFHSPDAPIGSMQRATVTIDKDGYRCSTADAFLPPSLAQQRSKNLKICTNSIVTSLDIQTVSGGKLKAVGIFFEKDGSNFEKLYHARARREIIVCAGAFGSPKLLMLSGLGPKDHLQEMGIKVKKDLPGVGSSLQDHFGISTKYSVPISDSLHVLQKRPFRAMWELIKYIIWGDGLFLVPVHPLSVFVKSSLLEKNFTVIEEKGSALQDARDPNNIRDIELMVVPANTSEDMVALEQGLFSFFGAVLQPRSKGTVRLASTDMRVHPVVDIGYLNDPADIVIARKTVLLSQRIAEKMREIGYKLTDYSVPASKSDEDLDAFIRKNGQTVYHYSSSCRMAPEDDVRPGVVDDELRVHGVEGLRIADASIFPDIIAGHIQAPVVMVAEKCADMVKRSWGLNDPSC